MTPDVLQWEGQTLIDRAGKKIGTTILMRWFVWSVGDQSKAARG